MRKLRIAFSLDMVESGTPRGALRLFRALLWELSRIDSIELICLGPKVSDPSDPVGSAYEALDTQKSLAFLLAPIRPANAKAETDSEPPPTEMRPGNVSVVVSGPIKWLQVLWRRAGRLYRRKIPQTLRVKLRPYLNLVLTPLTWTLKITGLRREVSDSMRSNDNPQLISLGDGEFTNRNIVGPTILLEDIDILLNFWWFHSPIPPSIRGAYRPPNLRVVSWFLDAIPLRVAHWQPGMIPVSTFREGIQAHLESSDEIVAISQSAADDIASFFPHIKKRIHVVPCGIFEEDFHHADWPVELANRGIDPSLKMFGLIGAMEPSKNVPNVLRALNLLAARRHEILQAVIIGAVDENNYKMILGPLAEKIQDNVRVIFAGHTDENSKRAIIERSSALVYASKWEGFGIPPLEGMALSVPLVVSDISPHREFCDGVADYCDPYDVHSIVDAIETAIVRPAEERAERLKLGLEVARRYSWQNAATRLVDSLRRKSPETI